MKKIVIGDTFTDFEGNELKGNKKDDKLTVRIVLMNLLATLKDFTPEEAGRAMKLGIDLANASQELVYEDQDETILKKAVAQNRPSYIVPVVGKLNQILNDSVTFNPNKA